MNKITSEKKLISQCFNRAASTYEQYDYVQSKVAEDLIEHLLHNSPRRFETTVDLGCGTAKNSIAAQKPQLINKYIGVDLAEKFLIQAKNRLPNIKHEFIKSDFDKTPLKDNYAELVFSSMALHWGLNLKTTINEACRICKPGATIAFSMPIIGTFNELHTSLKKSHFSNEVNKFETEDSLCEILSTSPLLIKKLAVKKYYQHFTSLSSLLSAIKKTGVQNVKNRTKINFLGKQYLETLEKNYPRYSGNPALTLTYRIAFIIAQKSLSDKK